MRERAESGFTSALELANKLMVELGMDFRSAHRLVGEIVSSADPEGQALGDAAVEFLAKLGLRTTIEGLEVGSVASRSSWGGGPGRDSLETCLRAVRRSLRGHRRFAKQLAARWSTAEAELDLVVKEFSQRSTQSVGAVTEGKDDLTG